MFSYKNTIEIIYNTKNNSKCICGLWTPAYFLYFTQIIVINFPRK